MTNLKQMCNAHVVNQLHPTVPQYIIDIVHNPCGITTVYVSATWGYPNQKHTTSQYECAQIATITIFNIQDMYKPT